MTEAAIKAREPFRFSTRLHLSELTGLKAKNLREFLRLLKTVKGSCIYYHTHRYLQQHQYLSPEPPNDFAYWVTKSLNEEQLGEMLASIDTIQFSTIRSLREKIVSTVSDYAKAHPTSRKKFADSGDEFHFIKALSFVIPTNHIANDLKEFADILEKITIDSIYFHVFEARLRLEKGENDFSNWIEMSVGDADLAKSISRLDPYTYTLDNLRNTMIKMIKKRIKT
jgi:hypothetical protein